MLPLNKNILLIMTGSIACYKACSIASSLQQKGYQVKTVLSPSSLEFIGAATLEGLTGEPPITNMYQSGSVMDHIHLARWADLIIVAPATANYINKIAHGIGDDLLTTLFLAHDFKKPFLISPAMNTMMYLHPTTQESMQKLRSFGVKILETESGVLACGEVGFGRLLDPDLIVQTIQQQLQISHEPPMAQATQPLKSLKVLITGGGTSEPIDDVRVITNSSTGKTAAYLANQLLESGIDVHFLHSKNSALPQISCPRTSFYSFTDLQSQLQHLLPAEKFDTVIHLAAVSDYSVIKEIGKISSTADELSLKLKKNKKLINEIKTLSPQSKLIGFKLTSQASTESITEKVTALFQDAHCDFVIHNDWADVQNQNHRFTVFDSKMQTLKLENKSELSFKIFQILAGDL